MTDPNYQAYARQAIAIELASVEALTDRIGQQFDAACRIMANCQGRIVVTGMGKSGHIAGKIAATLASTGTPAFFVHPGEASHGDLGMITPDDVVLAISNSGNTEELLTILPLIKKMGIPLISMTGNAESSLAQNAQVNLDVSVDQEACPLGLAPTSSTTVTLVMGDALAVALLEASGFSKTDFAFSHPSGSLGKRLLLTVGEIMHQNQEIPIVGSNMMATDALREISAKGFGLTAIADQERRLQGVFTDGDLRRAIDANIDLKNTPVSMLMSTECATISIEDLAADALDLMHNRKVMGLIVCDPQDRITGIVHMHDLFRAGLK